MFRGEVLGYLGGRCWGIFGGGVGVFRGEVLGYFWRRCWGI